LIENPKTVEFNKSTNEVIIKEERRAKIGSASDIQEAKLILETELRNIIGQVKTLKKRAFEIKGLLGEIEKQEKEAGPIKDPA
jgi:hypothetical protein